jgi:hypothetical protein
MPPLPAQKGATEGPTDPAPPAASPPRPYARTTTAQTARTGVRNAAPGKATRPVVPRPCAPPSGFGCHQCDVAARRSDPGGCALRAGHRPEPQAVNAAQRDDHASVAVLIDHRVEDVSDVLASGVGISPVAEIDDCTARGLGRRQLDVVAVERRARYAPRALRDLVDREVSGPEGVAPAAPPHGRCASREWFARATTCAALSRWTTPSSAAVVGV